MHLLCIRKLQLIASLIKYVVVNLINAYCDDFAMPFYRRRILQASLATRQRSVEYINQKYNQQITENGSAAMHIVGYDAPHNQISQNNEDFEQGIKKKTKEKSSKERTRTEDDPQKKENDDNREELNQENGFQRKESSTRCVENEVNKTNPRVRMRIKNENDDCQQINGNFEGRRRRVRKRDVNCHEIRKRKESESHEIFGLHAKDASEV